MGILVGGGMLLFILLASLGVLTAGGKESAAAGFLLGGSGIIASISIMVGYPIMTAISGALAAVFYNLLAMLAGGVVLRLQEKREL